MRRAGSWSGIAGVIGGLAVLALRCGAQSDARAQSGDVSPGRRHEVVVTIRNGVESQITFFFLDAAFEHRQLPEFESAVSEAVVRKDETNPLVIRPKRKS